MKIKKLIESDKQEAVSILLFLSSSSCHPVAFVMVNPFDFLGQRFPFIVRNVLQKSFVRLLAETMQWHSVVRGKTVAHLLILWARQLLAPRPSCGATLQ